VKKLVEAVVDLDAAPREFLVRPNHDASGELEQLHAERRDVESRVDALVQRLQNGALKGMDARLEKDAKMLKTYGYHFRVHKKHDKQLKAVEGEYLNVANAGIRWSTVKLKTMYDDWAALTQSLTSKQASIVKGAVEVAASHMPVFEMLAALLAELDVLGALAHVASQGLGGGYSRPVVGKSADVILKQARHPCLERQPDVTFVPNDHVMRAGSSRVQILTGPNMGGKSTYATRLLGRHGANRLLHSCAARRRASIGRRSARARGSRRRAAQRRVHVYERDDRGLGHFAHGDGQVARDHRRAGTWHQHV